MDEYGNKGTGYKPHTVEYADTNAYHKRPTLFQKWKAHMRKFWWAHLIFFCISTLIITLCVTYIGFPNIAQENINSATLDVIQQDVTNPQPGSVDLVFVTKAKNPSIFTPTLDSFEAILFLENTLNLPNGPIPFGKLTIPKQHATKEWTVTVNQRLDILDQEQFALYNGLVTASEEYRVAMRGKTALHLGGLPVTHVAFNKVVTMKGLNGLKGVQIRDMKIELMPAKDGTNMGGNIVINNPSVMSIALGNVTQNLYVDGTLIGYTYINNMVLKPGENSLPMRSTTDQAKVIGLITSKYKNAILPVDAIGNVSVANGQALPYFTKALAANPIRINLDVGPALAAMGLKLPPA